MSEQHDNVSGAADRELRIADLAHQHHAEKVSDAKELAADIWDSDEELRLFLVDLRASRNTSMG